MSTTPPSVSDTPVLQLQNVESAYGPIKAIRGVSLKVRRGEIATVLGSNGAGKTTILKTISGIIDPRKGTVEFKGNDITANDPAKIQKLIKLQTYHSEHLARFLKKMQEMPDGDGTMYDHMLMMYGSNMSNSDRHNQFPLPITLIGGACGKVKGGQHLRYPDKTPLANLLLTVLDRSGAPVDKVGDSTAVMAEV